MTSHNEQCLICGEGHLHQTVETNSVTYNGVTRDLPLYGSTCDACCSEQADAKDVRENKRAMQAFKKEVDGLLTGAEIIAIREQYGLTQKQAANIFGGGPVAFSKYEKDDVIQSESMNNLLYACRENIDTLVCLARKAGESEVVKRLTFESLGNPSWESLVDVAWDGYDLKEETKTEGLVSLCSNVVTQFSLKAVA